MSWTDEELDNLAREAAASSQVEYKDAYWHEMEALLGEKSTSKGGIWWWLTGIILLIGVSTVFVGSRIDGFDGINQTASSGELENVSLSTLNVQDNQLAPSPVTSEDARSNEGVLSVKSIETNSFVADKSFEEGTAAETNSNVLTKKSNTLQSQKAIIGKQLVDSKETSNDSKLNFTRPLMVQSSSETEGNNLTNENNLEGNDDGNTGNSLNNERLEVSELAVVDWNHEMTPTPIFRTEELPLLAGKRIGFYLGVNGGLGQSYAMTAKNNEIYQFALNGGLEFYRKNWAFGTGLGIRQQFTQNLTVVNSRRYYSYGAVNVNQNMTYDRMLFADLNLTASYRFGRSEVGVLVTPTYLLGARLSAVQSTEEIIGATSTMNYESKATKQYVSSENFNALGLNLGLNYSYSLMRSISIQAGVNMRVIQPMLNTRFEGVERKLPIMVELGLKKRF